MTFVCFICEEELDTDRLYPEDEINACPGCGMVPKPKDQVYKNITSEGVPPRIVFTAQHAFYPLSKFPDLCIHCGKTMNDKVHF